jgi:predicted phosphate transport protein (TIGR00153 family)
MRKGVHAYNEGDVERARELAKSAYMKEKDADEIKKAILDELVKGVFHPIDRDEILRLVLEADGIASNAKAAIGKLSMIPRDVMADSLSEKLAELSDKLVATVETLGEALGALVEGSENVIELSQKVESLEEEIDDFRGELVQDQFLPWCQEPTRAGLCIILKEAMDNMEKVADLAEDVADVIRSIAILSR